MDYFFSPIGAMIGWVGNMKYLLFILTLCTLSACASPQGNQNGNGPKPTQDPSGLVYMGVCNISPPALIFQPDIMSKQTWSVGNPPVIEQGICIPEQR